jgi:wyosine [tRNA(Phe)-imidazoG37] synthetase (radical SAM superfamily)
MIVFGPISSRRLGRSLGVNNIPSKHCTFSCRYCQAGRTPRTELTRHAFFEPEEIAAAVRARVEECHAAGERIDYISFVPDGEPTLDQNLGREILAVRRIGLPVAVLTNGSMLWRDDVRADLSAANLVSVEVDTLRELPWRLLNRPNPRLDLPKILEGIQTFAREFGGTLLTQTMLVAGVNDDEAAVREVAEFIEALKPTRNFLAVPTRPPTDSWVHPPDDAVLLRAFEAMRAVLPRTELLRAADTQPPAGGGDRITNLLATLRVHPMQRGAVEHYLGSAAALRALIASGRVKSVDYQGSEFVVAGDAAELEPQR